MLPTTATALSAVQLAHVFENGAILSFRDVPLKLDFLNFLSCSKTASLFIVFFIEFEFLAQSAGGSVWPAMNPQHLLLLEEECLMGVALRVPAASSLPKTMFRSKILRTSLQCPAAFRQRPGNVPATSR